MIKVYGADWCSDTKKTLNHLDVLGVDYEYVNVEQSLDASEWVKSKNDGKERKPTVSIGEKILSVPNENELDSLLKQEGLIN